MNSTPSIGAPGSAAVHLNAKKVFAWMSGGAYLAAVSVTAIYMLINGPAIRAARETYTAAQIDQENTQFCEKFGMPRGTDSFVTCVGYLAEVRKHHAERVTRELEPAF